MELPENYNGAGLLLRALRSAYRCAWVANRLARQPNQAAPSKLEPDQRHAA